MSLLASLRRQGHGFIGGYFDRFYALERTRVAGLWFLFGAASQRLESTGTLREVFAGVGLAEAF